MTVMTQAPPSLPMADPDVPIQLHKSDTPADRLFRFVLAAASVIVLAVLVAVVVFLAVDGWAALRQGGLRFFGATWAPDLGRFGMLPLLIGSIAIALVALIIALPISLATALMINEYLPPRLPALPHGRRRPTGHRAEHRLRVLGALVDFGATAPWAKWLVDHVSFVPFFRTPEPGSYVNSIFAVGLVCAVTLIPIITSVSRDVMSQARGTSAKRPWGSAAHAGE